MTILWPVEVAASTVSDTSPAASARPRLVAMIRITFVQNYGYMKPSSKVGLIALGYIAAYAAASVALAIRLRYTNTPEAIAQSGMNAFGDGVVFGTVFALAAVVPTVGILVLLRPYRGFWTIVSGACVVMALTGIAAMVLFAIGRQAQDSALATWASLSVIRILGSPFLALAGLVCAAVSPQRSHRFALLAATMVEATVASYGAYVWFVPLFLPSS